MPGQPEEYLPLVALAVLPGAYDIRWADGTTATFDEYRDIEALRTYYRLTNRSRRAHDKVAQRKAMKLLKSFLTLRQRADLSRTGTFLVETPSGNAYRIEPRRGTTEQVTRHGRRWFALRRFCLHDELDEGRMPPADLSLAHLLLLASDEAEFLKTANARDARDQLWNGAYLRRVRGRIRPTGSAEMTRNVAIDGGQRP